MGNMRFEIFFWWANPTNPDYRVLRSWCEEGEKTDSGGTGDCPLVECKGLYILPHSLR